MDAAARRWSCLRHTVVALTALAFISFSVVLLHDPENHSFVRHDRRNIQPVARESRPSPATTPAEVSVFPASSSSSFLFVPPNSSSAVFSSSPTPSSIETTSIPSTTHSSFSSSSSASVTVIIPSTVSSTSSQSAQTTNSSSVLSETQSTGSGKTTSFLFAESTKAPATTLVLTNNVPEFSQTSYLPYSQPTPSTLTTPTSNPVSAAVTSSGFWQKKGAVAATFLIVTLVILAISAILIITFLKRRSARRQDHLHEELFEKYSEPDNRGPSPGPSITSAPMDAFATREVRYDSNPAFQSYTVPQTQRVLHSSSPVQHPDYYNQPPSRYLAPSQAQAARGAAPPTAFRDPDIPSRDSYQPSIDSFYGAAGQPSHSS